MTKDKKAILIAFTFMMTMIILGIVRPIYLDNHYEENGGFTTTIAFCDKVGYKKRNQHSMSIGLHFYVKGEKIAVKGHGVPYSEPYISLQKGDTLIVSYAILNPYYCDVIKVKK